MNVEGLGSTTAIETRNAGRLRDAANQFEAMMITEMLKSAHSSGSEGWMGSNDDENSTLTEMSEQQFAQALAAQGGLGIAKMVTANLNPDANR
jgi:flagellar protein FlgJ